MESICHCLVSLKSPSKKKTKPKVAFAETPTSSSSRDQRTVRQPDITQLPVNTLMSELIDVERLYDGRLIDLVCTICTSCLVEIRKEGCLLHMKLLACLVPTFVCSKLLNSLIKEHSEHCNDSAPTSSSYDELCCFLIFSVLLPWMNGFQEQAARGETYNRKFLEFIVDIVCGVARTLPEDRQTEVISSILKVFCHSFVEMSGDMFSCAQCAYFFYLPGRQMTAVWLSFVWSLQLDQKV